MKHAIQIINELLEYQKQTVHYKHFSVALCTYNGEKYIVEQLDTILNQNLPPKEIVVCDDASIDQTWHILESYKSRYPDIFKIYRNERKLGVVKNFEKAINLCTQEIIFLSDQDDVWFPHKTERIMEVFNQYPDVEAVCHGLQICHEDKRIIPHTMWDTMGFSFFLKQEYPDKDYFYHTLIFGNMVTGAALSFKKTLQPINLLSNCPTVIHDYQLAMKYLSKGTMYFHDENLGLYRKHEEQLIGLVLDKIDQHRMAIKLYYEAKIPIINMIHILRRQYRDGVFDYIKQTDNQQALSLVRNAKINHIRNTFTMEIWQQIVKRLFLKLADKLVLKTGSLLKV